MVWNRAKFKQNIQNAISLYFSIKNYFLIIFKNWKNNGNLKIYSYNPLCFIMTWIYKLSIKSGFLKG